MSSASGGCRIDKRLQAVVEARHVVLLNLLRVLDGLDAQKANAQDERKHQA
jgi:hypothetical protein